MCRWIVDGVIVDVMPTDAAILGFSNRWYESALRSAAPRRLPSGTEIRLVVPPLFIATKLEAFVGRGRGDFQASHDLEDLLTVIDGRMELMSEIRAAEKDVRIYIASAIAGMLRDRAFVDAMPGHLPSDAASQARLPALVQRLQAIANLS